jgi:hypothetical protein
MRAASLPGSGLSAACTTNSNRKNLGLANNIGADGKTGSKRVFGFPGALRLHRTTPAVDPVKEPEELALGNKPWSTDRRQRQRFESVALPHLDAAHALARWMTHSGADAADVVQEAYLRAFRYFDLYRDGDVKSWLLKIVHGAKLGAALLAQFGNLRVNVSGGGVFVFVRPCRAPASIIVEKRALGPNRHEIDELAAIFEQVTPSACPKFRIARMGTLVHY